MQKLLVQKGYKTPKDLLLLTEEDCEEMKMEEVGATSYSHSAFMLATHESCSI